MVNKQKFRKLEVWKKAMGYIVDVYRITSDFPKSELYGLTGQIRRAAVSIAMNIAEGSGADTDKDFCRYLSISKKSNYETMCGFEIASKIKYLGGEDKKIILKKSDEIAAMLSGFIKKLKADG